VRGPRRAERSEWAAVGPVYRKPLRVFRADGSGARFITRLRPGRYLHVEPAWSPDGRQVAFSNGSASTQSIWKVDLASGRERRVTRSTVDSWPAWSPDGDWIAFYRGGQRAGLWAIRPDGTGERSISPMSDAGVGPSGAPSWSPNGRCLVVLAQDEHGQPRRQSSVHPPLGAAVRADPDPAVVVA
jgi:dipeptidyl aminopeptidase/acylaminoacyl peptidase